LYNSRMMADYQKNTKVFISLRCYTSEASIATNLEE